MIKYLKIEGLNDNNKTLEFNFNKDLNLFTGLNGCGKTTILKILWYINSGFIDLLVQECFFDSLELHADNYKMNMKIKGDLLHYEWDVNGHRSERELPLDPDTFYRRRFNIELPEIYYDNSEESIFFPTFRRIEGGFGMEYSGPRYRRDFPLKEVLCDLSDDLSSKKHQFIASVSTDDIITLLNKEYSYIVRKINNLQQIQFDEIRKKIRDKHNKTSDEILLAIENDIKTVEQERDAAMKPFTELEKLIMKIFHKKGIEMAAITFGDKINAISSDRLSAGEKQMLSFLCYNAFSKNKVIFIDEPELSLHPDWQRLLIPTLLRQENNNQFFIATHSPFIYTKYADKEIMLSEDKGGL